MRIVIQRVKQASVKVNGEPKDAIGQGLLVLLGIEESDTQEDANWLINKLIHLRIFDDEKNVMNLSVLDVGGEIMVVSQFTLMASYKKGNRPSWIRAARHEISIPLYEYFVSELQQKMNSRVATGTFGADMEVSLVNNGPVTICMDTKNKE